MRKINKLTPLAHFNGDNYHRICHTWQCFHEKYPTVYQDAKWQILMDEQKQQCAYTEIYINNERDSHIDHYKKRDHFSNLTFDWNNLFVSIGGQNLQNKPYGAHYKDNKYKIQQNEYPLIFNPIVDNEKGYFNYNEFGRIIENEEKVNKTIEVFNLNHELLIFKRKQLISLIEYFKNDGLSNLEIKTQLEDYGFKSVVEQYCKEEN